MYEPTDRHGQTIKEHILAEENKDLQKKLMQLRMENTHLRQYIEILEDSIETLRS